MAPMTQNIAKTWSPFDSTPIEIPISHRPDHQICPAPQNLKKISPIIEPIWNNSLSQFMLYSSWNDSLSSLSSDFFQAESPRPTQIELKNRRPTMLVNNMSVENITRCMQQQRHYRQPLPNRFMQVEASAFANLVGKRSHGTGVFHPPNPNFTNNIPFEMKIGMMQKKEEMDIPPSRNSLQVRENGLVEQEENSYDSFPIDINLPEEWTY